MLSFCVNSAPATYHFAYVNKIGVILLNFCLISYSNCKTDHHITYFGPVDNTISAGGLKFENL